MKFLSGLVRLLERCDGFSKGKGARSRGDGVGKSCAGELAECEAWGLS